MRKVVKWAIAAAFLIGNFASYAFAEELSGFRTTKTDDQTASIADSEFKSSVAHNALEQALSNWKGTPYKFGGLSKQGIDCSGFVKTALSDHFGIDMPRSTDFQVREGFEVNKENLKVGDLLFFKIGKKTQHVGIYFGEGKFVHASRKIGVTISNLSEKYWKKSYWTARRVLNSPESINLASNP